MADKLAKEPKAPTKAPGFEKYEVEDAVSTLLRAEEIRQNKPLMKEVAKKLEGKKKAITSIQGLKDRSRELEEEQEEKAQA